MRTPEQPRNGRGAALAILTDAFMDDPLTVWLFPVSSARRRLLPYIFGSLVDRADDDGELGCGPGAASVWVPLATGEHGFADLDTAPNPEADLRVVFGTAADRLLALVRMLAARHPTAHAHLYLAYLGVVPERRGEGVGSAMLRARLARADADGMPAYLEASSERSRRLYGRHGFNDLGPPIELPDGPRLWPMWRDPCTPT